MLLPTDLLGEWELRRTVDDRLAGVSGTVTGTTTLTRTGPDEVRWDEAGTMSFAGRETPVSRTLFVRRAPGSNSDGNSNGNGNSDGDGNGNGNGNWTVHFTDGRVFHTWTWGNEVSHWCAPDDYSGTLVGDTERWTVRWAATGPAKDYVLVSDLRRRTHPAD